MSRNAIQMEATMLRESFRFNQDGLNALIKGPVAQDLVRRAIKVQALAMSYASGNNGGPNVRTGRLRSSITWRLGGSFEQPYVDVGTAVFYAPFVELGTSRMPAYPFLRPALVAAR